MDRDRDSAQLPSNSYIPDGRGLGRPVDRRQEAYQPSRHASRKVLPHGDVTPDGERAWPQPSLTARIAVYGGAAIAAAAVTAGAVLAVRKVADLVTGNDEVDRDADRAADRARERFYEAGRGRAASPRLAAMSQRERDAMRSRARARMAEDEDARTILRARAEAARPATPRPDQDHPRPNRFAGDDAGMGPARPRRPRPQAKNLLGDIEHTAQSLTRNLNGIVGAVSSAVAAFRTVASQAESVVHEFHGTADQVRSFLGSAARQENDTVAASGSDRRRAAEADVNAYRRPRRSDIVDLRDDATAAESARTHRL